MPYPYPIWSYLVGFFGRKWRGHKTFTEDYFMADFWTNPALTWKSHCIIGQKPAGSFVKKPSNPIGLRTQCRLKKKRLCRRKGDSMWYQWVFASLLSLTWNSTSPIFLSRFRMISDQVLINKRRQSSSFCLDKLWTFDDSWSIKASSEMILKTGHPGQPQLTWLSHDYDIFFISWWFSQSTLPFWVWRVNGL